MPHRFVDLRPLGQTFPRTLGRAVVLAATLACATSAHASIAGASGTHTSVTHASPERSASSQGKRSAKAKSAKKSASTSAKKSRSTKTLSRASAKRATHAHAAESRAHGRHARAAHGERILHTVADTRPLVPLVPLVPVVPILPTIDLPVHGAAAGGAATSGLAAGLAPGGAAPLPALAFAAAPGADTLVGRSGKLRARFLVPSNAVAATFAGAARSIAGLFPYLRRVFGDSAARVAPGVYPAPVADGRPPFAFITMLPFSEKVAGRIGDYRIGFWPGESARRLANSYGNPMGFIEVTATNQATYVSEHFKLGDFLTHDQQNVWPKYLVLHEQLLDKLELVLDDLRAHGYKAERLHVMSGFRTPQYNQTGGDPSGRAELSRHQYGDAADVWVENGTGAMADLNGDGRIDARDAAVLAAAADRVEEAHPELVGGVGIYHGNGAHGPFVHIDTRGARARWGHG